MTQRQKATQKWPIGAEWSFQKTYVDLKPNSTKRINMNAWRMVRRIAMKAGLRDIDVLTKYSGRKWRDKIKALL